VAASTVPNKSIYAKRRRQGRHLQEARSKWKPKPSHDDWVKDS
jgi:hypothetical protein